MGADGVELDVTLSVDGEVVVMHDDGVERTTDGRGLVSRLTLTQLKSLDAGSWFGAKFTGERIPTLREVVEWAGDDMLLNIELKGMSLGTTGLEREVIRIVRECQLEDRVILSSFNPFTLWRVKRMAADLHSGLLYAEDLPLFLQRAWLRPLAYPDALHSGHSMVTTVYVDWARRKGYRVNVWTVDRAEEMAQLIAYGVDMIITNRPDVLSAVLRRQ